MSYFSCQKPPKNIKRQLIYFAIGRNITKGKRMRPISHEKINHLGKSCVTMTDLIVKFYEKLRRVILYVKNAPYQVVQTENLILKKN